MTDYRDEPDDSSINPAAFVDALENDRFKQFLDHVPVAVAVSELHPLAVCS